MRWLLVFCAALCIHGALSQSTEADHAETDILELDPGNARTLLGKGAEASVDHTTTTEVDHKRTARAVVQEGEALTFPAEQNAHKTIRGVSGRALLMKRQLRKGKSSSSRKAKSSRRSKTKSSSSKAKNTNPPAKAQPYGRTRTDTSHAKRTKTAQPVKRSSSATKKKTEKKTKAAPVKLSVLVSNGGDAKVVQLTVKNFKVDSRCTKFGALPSNPTCPEGYRITLGTLVNKRVYKHGVCTSVQTVLCQCKPVSFDNAVGRRLLGGRSSANCPTASCKTYSPKLFSGSGTFLGVTAGNDALYKSNFSAWSHTKLSTAVEKKVINTITIWSQDFIKIRAGEIAACGKSIERDNSTTSATGTDLVGNCNTATGLKSCSVPWGYDMSIPGSCKWEDTPTRCTLDNPLVQLFYSNLGATQTALSGRISMPGNVSVRARVEVARLKTEVKSALETAFPGEQVATNISSADVRHYHGNHFAIVIGAGQRNAVGRRLLGGPFQNNSELNQKQPGWYGCEVKYLAMVSVSPAQPRCMRNDRGGHLCEPQIAGSLVLWMRSQPKPNPLNMLYRPNNNVATCARVDTAVRLALTKYRFQLSAPERMSTYRKAVQRSSSVKKKPEKRTKTSSIKSRRRRKKKTKKRTKTASIKSRRRRKKTKKKTKTASINSQTQRKKKKKKKKTKTASVKPQTRRKKKTKKRTKTASAKTRRQR